MRILIIEGDVVISANLYVFLTSCGGRRGHWTHPAIRDPFDAIVLEVGLPGMDGMKLCHKLRTEAQIYTPILMLTARDTLKDKLQGFASGADN